MTIADRLIGLAARRPPDFVIGGARFHNRWATAREQGVGTGPYGTSTQHGERNAA